MVALQLSWYQRDVVKRFERTREPIIFGTRLLVVPVSGNPLLPFQLFAEEAAAKDAAAFKPKPAPKRLQHLLSEVIGVICEAVMLRVPAPDPGFRRAMRTVSFAHQPVTAMHDATLDAEQ